jgi:hypothetical protein
MDAISARLRAEIDAPRTIQTRLAELPTIARIGVGLVAIGFFVLLADVLSGWRPDLREPATTRGVLLSVGAAGVAIVAALPAALRSAGRGALPGWARRGLLVLAAVPLALSALPGVWGGRNIPAEDMPIFHVVCILTGALVATCAGSIVLILDRGSTAPGLRAAGTAGIAGLAAFVALQIHCAAGNWGHVVVTHGLHGLAAAVVLLLALRR